MEANSGGQDIEIFPIMEPHSPDVIIWYEIFNVLSMDMTAGFAPAMGMDFALSVNLPQIKEISRSFLFARARRVVNNDTSQYASDTFTHLNISLGDAAEKLYDWTESSFYDDASPSGMRHSDWYDVFVMLREAWKTGDEDLPWNRTLFPDLLVRVDESFRESEGICAAIQSIAGEPHNLSNADQSILKLQDIIRQLGLENPPYFSSLAAVCNSIVCCVSNNHVNSLREYFQTVLPKTQLQSFYDWGRRRLKRMYGSDAARPSEFFRPDVRSE